MTNENVGLTDLEDVIERDWARRIAADMQLEDFNEVLPGIIIGDKTLSEDKEKLKDLGVTHVLNSAMGTDPDQINTSEQFFKDVEIKFLGININDSPKCKLSNYFRTAAEFIESALLQKGKIFVHCMLGMSRSASLVLGYLMIKRSVKLIPAIKLLQEKRPVDINSGFLMELKDLEQEIFS